MDMNIEKVNKEITEDLNNGIYDILKYNKVVWYIANDLLKPKTKISEKKEKQKKLINMNEFIKAHKKEFVNQAWNEWQVKYVINFINDLILYIEEICLMKKSEEVIIDIISKKDDKVIFLSKEYQNIEDQIKEINLKRIKLNYNMIEAYFGKDLLLLSNNNNKSLFSSLILKILLIFSTLLKYNIIDEKIKIKYFSFIKIIKENRKIFNSKFYKQLIDNILDNFDHMILEMFSILEEKKLLEGKEKEKAEKNFDVKTQITKEIYYGVNINLFIFHLKEHFDIDNKIIEDYSYKNNQLNEVFKNF